MITNYQNFINESKFNELKSKYNSIGEWVESVSKGNDYLLSIISNYINDVDVTIRVSNAVNLLSDFDQKQLFYRIYNYINNDESEKEKDSNVMTNVVIENEENVYGGKHIFQSFLKALTALGLSKTLNKSHQEDYLFYYLSGDVEVNSIKNIFSRFKSLTLFGNRVDYTFNTCKLYYGINSNGNFDYGFYTNQIIPIGQFKMSKSNLSWLLLNSSPSSLILKKDLVSLDMNQLVLFSKICKEMKTYQISAEQKSGPFINDGVISFGYYGIGKWNSSRLDDEEYQNLKNNFKNWLVKYKWSDKILISITHSSYWVYFNLKIK